MGNPFRRKPDPTFFIVQNFAIVRQTQLLPAPDHDSSPGLREKGWISRMGRWMACQEPLQLIETVGRLLSDHLQHVEITLRQLRFSFIRPWVPFCQGLFLS